MKARITLERQQATSKKTSILELELDTKQFPNHPPASIKLNTKLGPNHKQNNQLHINKNLPSRYTQSCGSRRNNRNRRAACITNSEGEEAVGTSDRRRASERRRARERSRLGRRMKKENEICPVQDSCGQSQLLTNLPTYLPTCHFIR